jgi:hypothetical protein
MLASFTAAMLQFVDENEFLRDVTSEEGTLVRSDRAYLREENYPITL